MIQSMTGCGRAKEGNITIELRSVNHRYLDLSVRLPRALSFLEEPLRRLVSGHISRGKVELGLTLDSLAAETTALTLNRDALERYLDMAGLLEEEYGLTGDLTVSRALRLPDLVVSTPKETDREAKTQEVLAIAEAALQDFMARRAEEGARLRADILVKLSAVRDLAGRIETRLPESVEAYKNRLLAKIQEILADTALDEGRILTEAALFADKVAADEELVRLRSHCQALEEMLETGGPVGRKLDFLVQEFGREANTIGSKCSDTQITRWVLDLKGEIEKIREQVQNIE